MSQTALCLLLRYNVNAEGVLTDLNVKETNQY